VRENCSVVPPGLAHFPLLPRADAPSKLSGMSPAAHYASPIRLPFVYDSGVAQGGLSGADARALQSTRQTQNAFSRRPEGLLQPRHKRFPESASRTALNVPDVEA
jgi:hypothetical protein